MKLPIFWAYALFLSLPLYAQSVELYPFPENGKWGYIDTSGKVIIPAGYDSAAPFSEGLGRIGKEANGLIFYGFVNWSGEEVIPPKYNEVSVFKGGVAVVKFRGKYAYLTPDGTLFNELYDEIYPVSEGISRFKKNGLFGYAKDGAMIVPPIFAEAEDFSSGLALVQQEKLYGYLNKDGAFAIPAAYPQARSFSGGAAAVLTREGWHLINNAGIALTAQPYQKMNSLSGGLAKVVLNGVTGYINASGALVIPSAPEGADDFSKGLARIVAPPENKVGYLTRKGEFINGTGLYTNEPAYPFTAGTAFDGRYARVSIENSNGFMNAEGRFNVSDKVLTIGSFFKNRARVKIGRYYGFFDEEAKIKISPIYLQAGEFQSALTPVLSPIPGGYRAGYINVNGDEVYGWEVFAKPVPADKDKLYVISQSLPLFRESNPESRILTQLSYGSVVEKAFQRTATPLAGMGMRGLLYAVSNYGNIGFAFSEALSSFPPPVRGMGIFAYFRDKFGVISLSSAPENGALTAAFFNGAVLNRLNSQGTVIDLYYIPYMKPSEAFFLFSAALGRPAAAYPDEGTENFTGTLDGDGGNPSEFTMHIQESLISVSKIGEGIQVEHRYPEPVQPN